jgi:hypothetical protein
LSLRETAAVAPFLDAFAAFSGIDLGRQKRMTDHWEEDGLDVYHALHFSWLFGSLFWVLEDLST